MTQAGEVQVLVDVAPALTASLEPALVGAAVREAMRAAGADCRWSRAEVGVRITDEAEMQRLNRDYRGVDSPTDVLSFSFVEKGAGQSLAQPPDAPTQLGDIAVSYPRVERQAEELGHSPEKELAWLIIHGTLQLLGYTHDADEDAARMEALEQVALRSLGFGPEPA